MTKDYTTSNFDLLQLNKNPHFKGVFSKDNKLPPNTPGTGYIVNLESTTDGNGTHWIGVTHDNKQTYYYDPFGMVPPDMILKKIKGNTDRPVVYSDVQIQNDNATTCGYFASSFLKHMTKKGMPSWQKYYDYIYKIMEPNNPKNNERVIKKEFKLT